MSQPKVMLVIMDGWGLGPDDPGAGASRPSDAIRHARTPFVSSLYDRYPNTTLVTCGEAVGLPAGQMGNSEVGHLNLGAGRIVYQELERINVAIRDGSFAKNPALLASIRYAKKNHKSLHLLGLVSDGGVHSHTRHLRAITTACRAEGFENVFVHAFTDGRDTDPKSGLGFLEDLEKHLSRTTGRIATITGRYYAMDRDKRWERVKVAYDALVRGAGALASNPLTAVGASYEAGITDEFIRPIIAAVNGKPLATVREGDAVICFNFRTDRCREITQALTQQAFPDQGMQPVALHYTTMTEYDKTFQGVHVIFESDNLSQTLGEVLSQHGKSQIRIAETEKYPHVSFFSAGDAKRNFPAKNA